MDELSVFLSYDVSGEDMVAVWRLQTLAAAHGIALFVPHPQDRQGKQATRRIKQMIDSSDLLVILCTKRPGRHVLNELSCAKKKGKPVLPILEKGIPLPAPLKRSPAVSFSPAGDRPEQLEGRVIEHLARYKGTYGLKKKESTALAILLGIGVGLLALRALTDSGKR